MTTPIYTAPEGLSPNSLVNFEGVNIMSFPEAKTGTVMDFRAEAVWGSVDTPETDDITWSTLAAKPGIIQKMYHSYFDTPTFPAEWVLMGTSVYTENELNVIYAEYISASRVEYWISQEV